jgi:hypothetical protein
MTSPYEVRHKYRNAMFDMSQLKTKTKKFLVELQEHYGCRMKALPERLRIGLDDFLKMEKQPEGEKVLDPTIPGTILSKANIPMQTDEVAITKKYQTLREMLREADVLDKVDALQNFTIRRAEELEKEKELSLINTRSKARNSSNHQRDRTSHN